MRILNITGAFPPAFVLGGPVYTVHRLSRALIDRGHDVFVLTTDKCGEHRLTEVPVGEDTEWDGVPVRYCHWVKSVIPYHSPDLARQVSARAHEFDIAILNATWTGYGVLAGRACRRAGLPYVAVPHGSYAPLRLRKAYWRKRLWWTLLDRGLYNRARAVVALTAAEIGEIRAMGVVVPVVHIPNAVDLDGLADAADRQSLEAELPALEDRRYVLFLGRLDPLKGLDWLVSAFAAVAGTYPDVLLVVAGPDDRGYRQEIEAMVARHRLRDRVVFTGMVSGALKAGLLREAELFALTSRGEGMSIATLEALACGVPVLITDACNLPEVEQFEAGIVVPVGDLERMEHALRRLLSDDRIKATMGRNARRLVAERIPSWPEVARQTADLCSGIIENGSC